MITVPKGKEVVIGGKTYKSGAVIPDCHVKLLPKGFGEKPNKPSSNKPDKTSDKNK